MMSIRRHKVKKTLRVAASIPLIRTMSSGIARRSRAIRAMRERRSNLAMRRIEALPTPALDPEVLVRATKVSAQVSSTMDVTSMESKTNHPSFKPFRLRLNDMKRTNHSKVK
mmetsp:Transcript_130714/g.240461  ORF Transcript_130714/g.240461 Transcript_130714/m.240461 type:complete len:112 (-) Transcript_130714:127-462(-)